MGTPKDKRPVASTGAIACICGMIVVALLIGEMASRNFGKNGNAFTMMAIAIMGCMAGCSLFLGGLLVMLLGKKTY